MAIINDFRIRVNGPKNFPLSNSQSGESGSVTDIGGYGNPDFIGTEYSGISKQIIMSDTYRQAYNLFAPLSDKSWLNQLVLIVDSYKNAAGTFLDDLGLSTKQETADRQSYQDAMVRIQQLVAKYYEHVNSLPSTQVQQYADAGINSAITGQGVTSSQYSSSVADPSPVLESSQPIDAILSAGQFVLSAVSGWADLAIKFKDLGLRSKKQSFDIDKESVSFVTDLKKYMRENGITSNDFNFNDLVTGKDLNILDPKGDVITLDGILTHGLNLGKYEALFNHIAAEYPDFTQRYFPRSVNIGNSTHRYFANSGDPIMGYDSVGLSDVTQAYYDIYKLSRDFSAYKNKYDSEILSYQVDTEEYKSKQAEYDSESARFDKERKEIIDNLIDNLAASDNPADQALLLKILTSYNYMDINKQTIDNVTGVVNPVSGVIDSVVPF